MAHFPFSKQFDAMDCGPACLQMIARHYGQSYPLDMLRERSFLTREGVSLRGVKAAAESIGLHAHGVRITFEQLARPAALPCIVYWQQRHFIVVYAIEAQTVSVADPACGLLTYSKAEFLQGWLNGQSKGVALLLTPTWQFYGPHTEHRTRASFLTLWPYLKPYRGLFGQLGLGILAGSVIQLLLPFLAQILVDIGIGQQNLPVMYIVLAAQLTLFLSRTGIEWLRRWLLLHISTRINVALLADFLSKLLRLPLGFFETKTLGDLLQRIDDHARIEAFLTTAPLSLGMAGVTFIVFSIVLASYQFTIWLVFLAGSSLYILWNLLFLRRRRTLDFKRFLQLGEQQSKALEILTGIREIRVNTCEEQQLGHWAALQGQLFRTSLSALKLNQAQEIGAMCIDQLQNIILTFLAVKAVLDGRMTLGMVLAIQYILGQLYGPIAQIVELVHVVQDAKLSLERIREIHQQPDEDPPDAPKIQELPEQASLHLSEVSFRYGGPHAPLVLKNISLSLPVGKVTAIVGPSGSGKTTLLKLLLGFYPPTVGVIRLGEHDLKTIRSRTWRSQCGVVMQDGILFTDTIARNIALSSAEIDVDRLQEAAEVANIREFIEALPAGYETRIGEEGYQVSQGQKQRLLIARAVYKQPRYVFLDEATNALDAENERRILAQLNRFFEGHTVVIVAHRLSTVKRADQIVVIDQGQIAEIGTHESLTQQQGRYYYLIKEQLELGNS
jgi:ATP-binding cassette subfamily B protein